MTQVLLLGATGFVGSSIAKELDHQGIDWVGVARNYHAGERPTLSLGDRKAIILALESRPIIINALGGLKPKSFSDNFSEAMNEFWTSLDRLTCYLQDNPPAGILHISSAGTVYGEAPGRPSLETDPLRPSSWYGRMKVMEEGMIRCLANDYDIPIACARVSNPFGNREASHHGLIDVLITRLRKREAFQAAFPEGAQRDFIYAPCMAERLVRLAMEGHTGIFNVGGGVPTPLQSIIDKARELVPGASITKSAPNPSDIVNSYISTAKVNELLGPSGCALTIEQYLINKLG